MQSMQIMRLANEILGEAETRRLVCSRLSPPEIAERTAVYCFIHRIKNEELRKGVETMLKER
jgi:hypothetical protein